MGSIKDDASKLKNWLIRHRRWLHEHPELAFEEIETSQYICEVLDGIGVSYTKNIAKTGILVTINGEKEGKSILIRADIDALPMKEKNDIDYKSTNNNSHACGHDGHTAILLGVVKLLYERKASIDGTIYCIFQPAEEKPPGGAIAMLDEINIDYDAAIALHLTNRYKTRSIAINKGVFVGSTDAINIKIHGKSGHASAPHEGVDPIAISSQLITSIYTYLSRRVDPMEPHVFTVGKIEGGSRYNILADDCRIECALRTQNQELRDNLINEIKTLTSHICKANLASYSFELQEGYRVGKNDEVITDLIVNTTEDLYGKNAVTKLEHGHLIGEDFFEFSKGELPVAMFWLGGQTKEYTEPNHSSRFNFDESTLPVGVAILAQTAINFIKSTK